MKKVVVVLAVFISIQFHWATSWSQPRCSEIFEESTPFFDQSGFINLYGAPKKKPHKAPKDPLENIEGIIKKGRWQVRKSNWDKRALDYFRKIQGLSQKEIQELPPKQLIKIYSLHASWNLLLPTQFGIHLFKALSKSLPQWTQKDFQNFSFSRLLTPEPLPQPLQSQLRQVILKNFEKWSVETKMQVLSAEIIQRNFWSIKDSKWLLESTISSLSSTPKILRLKVLKETFRAMIYLRSQQPTIYWNEIVRLESLIEAQLNQQGLYLYEGGSSGSNNPERPFGPSFLQLMEVIDAHFPHQVKKFEYFDSRMMGLFDPVDLYYPNLRLIVEWDGPIHYFKRFNPDGSVNMQSNVLRPWDKVKDASLRSLGISVFRLNKTMNGWLGIRDINVMIREQNPHTWEN